MRTISESQTTPTAFLATFLPRTRNSHPPFLLVAPQIHRHRGLHAVDPTADCDLHSVTCCSSGLERARAPNEHIFGGRRHWRCSGSGCSIRGVPGTPSSATTAHVPALGLSVHHEWIRQWKQVNVRDSRTGGVPGHGDEKTATAAVCHLHPGPEQCPVETHEYGQGRARRQVLRSAHAEYEHAVSEQHERGVPEPENRPDRRAEGEQGHQRDQEDESRTCQNGGSPGEGILLGRLETVHGQ